MTEDEAKTKWCPLARVWADDVEGGSGSVSINRYGDHDKTLHPNAMCIGSACMAWRRTEEFAYAPEGASPGGDGWKKDSPSGDGRIEWSRPGGYCGAFSNPKP